MKSRNVFYPLSKGEFLFSCLLFTGIWLYIFLSTRIYEVGFNYFLDDHQIIIKHSDNFDIYKIIIEPIILYLNDRSRFRPLHEIFLRFFSTAYGLNPLLWYLSSLFVAIATTTNFYIFSRLQSFPILESILFALLIVFGDQSSTYARFGTPETTATFLTSLAFIFGSLSIRDNINKRVSFLLNFLFLFFVMLTAFNKEACILMLPAFAFFKAWVFSRKNKVSLYQSLSINRYIVIFILSIFFLLIAYIKLRGVSGPGYAGIDHDSLSIIHLARIFKTLVEKSSFGLAIIVNIIYFILCFLRLKIDRRNEFDWGFYLFVGLIIIPQIIIYAKSDIGYHYLLPCVIGIAFLTIYPLVKMQRLFSKYFIIVNLLIILMIYNNIVATQVYFNRVSKPLKNMQTMVQDISSCLKDNSQSLVFGNPYVHYEGLYGYKKAIVDKILNPKIESVFLITYGHSKTDLKSEVFNQSEKAMSFLNPAEVEGWYDKKTMKRLDQKKITETHGILVFGYHEFENDFKKLTSGWFDFHEFKYKYYPDLNIGFYCKK